MGAYSSQIATHLFANQRITYPFDLPRLLIQSVGVVQLFPVLFLYRNRVLKNSKMVGNIYQNLGSYDLVETAKCH